MRRLSRRLALWGGAAAIAGGGFAFMANNAVATSSAGEGVGAVTGYTVSAITYNDTCPGGAPNAVCATSTFTFHLKPTTWTTSAPKSVAVTLFGPSGVLAKVSKLGITTSGGTITVTLKTTTKPTSTRYFLVHVAPTSPVLLHTITGLDVAASL
jgi:hypothetical protein